MSPWTFAKMNPLLSAGIVAFLCVAIFYTFNTIYAGAKIAILDHQNKVLEVENKKIGAVNDKLAADVETRNGVIAQQTKELNDANLLLQSISQKVVSDKQALDAAVDNAARLSNDNSPITHDELKAKLCGLYNIPPSTCR